jgi:CubicO group peptidase (beta-lactamase class C family)
MNYEKIIRDLDSLGVNMMDIAIQPIGGEELYHKFQHCSNCMNGYSVTKSFTMTAIGMLMDEGKLDVEGKALPFLTDGVADELDPHWQDVTIEQLILHRAGYDADWLDIDTQDVNSYGTKDYLSYVMKKPLPHTPGEFYKYNDHCYYLLSRIATKAAGEEMTAYLQRKVIDDLNFHEIAWSRCPQGYAIGAHSVLTLPDGTTPAMAVPSALLPRCPNCGRPLTMNLRADDKFVEDAGWHAAAERYAAFARDHAEDRILYLEIGVGWNTPGIIKFNFWDRAKHNTNAIYACLNHDDARIPEGLEDRGIAIAGDSAQVISALTFR